MIAGPCAVESDDDARRDRRARSRTAGANILRGGAFKPRTSPYSFQGLGEEGLQDPPRRRRQVRHAGRHRGHGPAAGRARRPLRRHVPDRRPQHAELRPAQGGRPDAQAGAAQARHERDGQGPADVGRVHPGRRATATWSCASAASGRSRTRRATCSTCRAVPNVKGQSHLPIIVDPSHATGRPDLIPAMARAGGRRRGATASTSRSTSARRRRCPTARRRCCPTSTPQLMDELRQLAERDGQDDRRLRRSRPSDATPCSSPATGR